jgi:hypothetical protein
VKELNYLHKIKRMGPEGLQHEPHKIDPDKLPKVYKDLITENPNGGGYILNTECADPILEKEEEIAQIEAELATPDLDPKLRALFQTLLERKQNELLYGNRE